MTTDPRTEIFILGYQLIAERRDRDAQDQGIPVKASSHPGGNKISPPSHLEEETSPSKDALLATHLVRWNRSVPPPPSVGPVPPSSVASL